jgi:hypothetical protein
MADFTVTDRDAYERKVTPRALAAAKHPEVRALLDVTRAVLAIPARGFGRDTRGYQTWRRALDMPAQYRAVQEHPRFQELLDALGPLRLEVDPAPNPDEHPAVPLGHRLILPAMTPARILAWAAERVVRLGHLDHRFISWAGHLIEWGQQDLGRIVLVQDLYVTARGDPERRAFPPEVPCSAISKAMSDERLRLANGYASPGHLNRCIHALVNRKHAVPELSWAQQWAAIALSAAAQAPCMNWSSAAGARSASAASSRCRARSCSWA